MISKGILGQFTVTLSVSLEISDAVRFAISKCIISPENVFHDDYILTILFKIEKYNNLFTILKKEFNNLD